MTHCDRLLAVLADGKPHDHHELYALNMIVHSRVADLRRKGFEIACWSVNENGERLSIYQLLPAALGTGESNGGVAPSPVPSAAPDPPSSGAASTYTQMVLA